MTLGDLIKAYRSEHDMSMDAFAEKSGISKAYVSLLEKNRHPKTGKPISPSLQCIKLAAVAMGYDFDRVISLIDGNVDLSNGDTSMFSNLRPISKKQYPVLGAVACGDPTFMSEMIEVYVEATTAIHADFVLIAKGDSMIGARINDGDLVFIRQQPEVENGEIAAVAIGDEAQLKRVYYYANKSLLVLRSENPNYPDYEYSGEKLDDVRILGKAIAFQSNVK